jgi:hypothetical protein
MCLVIGVGCNIHLDKVFNHILKILGLGFMLSDSNAHKCLQI